MVEIPKDNIEVKTEDNITLKAEDNIAVKTEDNIEVKNGDNNNDNYNDGNYNSNCLALTLKKDYHLSVFKNITFKAFKGTWRIAISIMTLNFLSLFL